MNTDLQDIKYKELTKKIIKIFYKVYNTLGYGFLEKIYENAMMIEFDKEGIPAVAQSQIKVLYEDEVIGEYFADILVDDKVIVEIKGYIRISQSLKYVKYQACSAFYPDFKCAEFCQFLFNISGCKRFTLKPAGKSTCAPTSLMVAHSRTDCFSAGILQFVVFIG